MDICPHGAITMEARLDVMRPGAGEQTPHRLQIAQGEIQGQGTSLVPGRRQGPRPIDKAYPHMGELSARQQ